MSIGYRRYVHVRRGCAERFQRLMAAYAAHLLSCGAECHLRTLRTGSSTHLFVVDEEFPDRDSVLRVHRRSDFERLWLPVILSLIDRVHLQRFSRG